MSYLGPDQYQYVDVVPQYKNLLLAKAEFPLRRKTISSRLIDLSLYPHSDYFLPCDGFFYIESVPGCIFSTQTRSADISSKINCWEWLVESETKTSAVTSQHATVGTVWKFSVSRDLQGLNCQIMQMLLIDICGISLIDFRMSLVCIWLSLTTCWLA